MNEDLLELIMSLVGRRPAEDPEVVQTDRGPLEIIPTSPEQRAIDAVADKRFPFGHEDLSAMKQSPFVQDTLNELFGTPRAIMRMPFIPAGYGAAFPRYNVIGLGSNLGGPEHEDLLIHEFAHIADFTNRLPELKEQVGKRWRELKLSNDPRGGYARKRREEHFAEAVTTALQTMRQLNYDMERQPFIWREDMVEETLREMDTVIPGTFEALKWLGEHEFYKNTPVGRVIQGMRAPEPLPPGPMPADVTRVAPRARRRNR